MRRLAATVACVLAGCQPSGAFYCLSDEDCMHAGERGTCEVTGFCSFADPSCDTGRRYGDYAADNLGGRCVPSAGELEPDAGAGQPDATPVEACTGLGAPAAGAYAHHSCAALGDGSLWCWGLDSQGQIGNGGFGGVRRKPEKVDGVSAPASVAAGRQHSCAVAAGDLWCWGDNQFGQLGFNGADRDKPKQVNALSGVLQVDASGDTTCAVTEDLEVHCWGRNNRGQVGSGDTDNKSSPTLVPGLVGATQVAAGVTASCARLGDGSAWCWGAGDEGQLGDGTGTDSLVPVKVKVGDVAEVDVGDDHACARRSDGTVACWGDNEAGGLGDGTRVQRASPVEVPGIGDAVELEVGDEFTCVRRASGSVLCWGANDHGQLGAGTSNDYETAPVQVLGLSDAVAIAAGADHACATRASGHVVCWGDNGDGQLGDETSSSRATPEPVRLTCP